MHIALTKFFPESLKASDMGSKMTGIAGLVGTEHIFNILRPIFFEIFAKKQMRIYTAIRDCTNSCVFGLFMIIN